jgi:hypothetical protein
VSWVGREGRPRWWSCPLPAWEAKMTPSPEFRPGRNACKTSLGQPHSDECGASTRHGGLRARVVPAVGVASDAVPTTAVFALCRSEIFYPAVGLVMVMPGPVAAAAAATKANRRCDQRGRPGCLVHRLPVLNGRARSRCRSRRTPRCSRAAARRSCGEQPRLSTSRLPGAAERSGTQTYAGVRHAPRNPRRGGLLGPRGTTGQ